MGLMVYQINRGNKPYLTFAYCILSGVFDTFDGDAARYFKQGSRFGYLMDVAMDKLNNLAQYYALTSMYPSYAISLLCITFVEMTEVITTIAYKEYKFKYQLARVLASGNVSMDAFKGDFLTEMGMKSIKPGSGEIELNQPSGIDFWSLSIHFIWNLNDIFFWLLYFNYFAQEYNQNLNGPQANGSLKKKGGVENMFENLAAYAEYYLKKVMPIKVNFQLAFKLLSIACFAGVVLKTVHNFKVMMNNYLGVLDIDNQLNILLPKIVSQWVHN